MVLRGGRINLAHFNFNPYFFLIIIDAFWSNKNENKLYQEVPHLGLTLNLNFFESTRNYKKIDIKTKLRVIYWKIFLECGVNIYFIFVLEF